MANFTNHWIKESKKDTSGKIRDTLRSAKPLKPTMESAKNRLGIQTQKLDALLEKLKAKDRSSLLRLLLNYSIMRDPTVRCFQMNYLK